MRYQVHDTDGWVAAEALRLDVVPRRAYRRGAKRCLDVVLVLLAAPTALAIVLGAALLVALDGHNPFFSQIRVGRNGRHFRLWKLRSMVPDAEALLERHLENCDVARREWTEKQKLTNDPRVTRTGAFLRKTSIDELPQLWNVLVGQMSLVGPRPFMANQAGLYPGKAYFRLRPGITGNWQVSDRNASTFAARARFDDEYDRALSLVGDVRILAQTVAVVFRCTGC
ncbi:sugar transferase [Roseivivax marinus]|uniref:sugar transferase n=1 Tax=Roseivivax marinus TaxID=1379903 RepID=UPI001F047F8D|nr:sugar transferase [Roseivivax marinus]UMA63286.1 sugar transferase [Roseivivax marinus]